MSEVKISAEPRTEFGKGGARRTRRAGKVPAVVYGHGESPKHIALPAREFAAAIRQAGAAHLRLRTDSDWLLDIVRFVAASRHARTRGTTR